MKTLNSPMRVLHILSGDRWAGAEVQAYTLLKHLAPAVSLKVILLNEGELADRLRQLDIELHILREASLRSPQLFWRIFKIILAFKPSVVHTHRQKENILGGLAHGLARLLGCSRCSVRTLHGAAEFAPRGLQRLQVWLDRWVAQRIQQGIIAVSQDLKNQLVNQFPPSKVILIRNGVDLQAMTSFENVIRFSPQENCKHIGIIGRLEPVKRVDIFLHMAKYLIDNSDPAHSWRFHIIGEGKLLPALRALTADLMLDDYVIFHGQCANIPAYLQALDGVLMCSDHEGTPMVALEALALGTPLMAHNVGGLQEILQDYPNLLVDEHTPEAYGAAWQEFFNQAQAAPVKLRDCYSAAVNAQQTLALYAQLQP